MDLTSDSCTLSTEPNSGFMLLSVKRMSKLRHGKRSNSANSVSRKSPSKLRGQSSYTTGSSRDESGATSQSEDAAQEDMYGSGSIDAEDFEEDDDDDPDENDKSEINSSSLPNVIDLSTRAGVPCSMEDHRGSYKPATVIEVSYVKFILRNNGHSGN